MRVSPIALLVAFACVCAYARGAGAQRATPTVALRGPPAPGYAAILGVVDDSLRGRPLAGATVIVAGTERRAITAEDGIFRIDSLSEGEVTLHVRHPLLDSLFVTVTSGKVALVPGKLEQLFISTPRVDFLRERVCPRGGVIAGDAFLAGRVDQADTDKPVAGAVVSFVYTDPATGTSTPRLRTTRTRTDGFYAICGLPETLSGTVQAAVGANTSSEIPIALKGDLLATASFLLGPGTKADSGVRGNALMRGRVTDAAGKPMKDAQVTVEGGNVIATTGDDGTYTLAGLAPGTTSAVFRKVGFAPVYRTVHLRSAQPQTVSAALSAGVTTLATVKVTAGLDPGLRKLGFMERRNMGLRSNFLLPEDIEKRQVARLSDLIRGMSGFRVSMVGNNQVVESSRATPGQQSGCVNFYVDRMPFEQMTAGDLDMNFPVHTIAAIEGYSSATETPAEFRMSGRNCATIVIWSRIKLSKP